MDDEWLAKRFEADRTRLQAVAYRVLGSAGEADDAVQEAWLRLSRSDTSEVENLSGWLTTVVARVCLDMLRSRRSRREERLALDGEFIPDAADPERDAMLAESVGLAMQAVVQRLAPAERVAFVLHDLFDLPFEEIAPILGRSEAAARQLASRARRRVRGASQAPDARDARQREVVAAFLAASRDGNFQALVALLDPAVVLRADEVAVQASAANQARGAPPLRSEIRGAAGVADTFRGRAAAARLALVDGSAGAVWAQGGKPRVVFEFSVEDGKIVEIRVVMDPARVQALDVELLGS